MRVLKRGAKLFRNPMAIIWGLTIAWYMILSGLPAGPACAGPNAGASILVDLDPSAPGCQATRTVGQNVSFKVDIIARHIVNLDTYDLQFVVGDSNKLQILEAKEGPALRSLGGRTLFMSREIGNDVIQLTGSLSGSNPDLAPDGEGVIAHVNLKMLSATGKSTMSFRNVTFWDSARVEDSITDTTGGIAGASFVGPNAGASVLVDLDPSAAGYQATRTVSRNTSFQVDIIARNIVNLDTYDLQFMVSDPGKLQILEAKEGPALKSSGGTTLFMAQKIGEDIIQLTDSLSGNKPALAPDGEGVIAHVSLKMLSAADSAAVSFKNVMFWDSNNEKDSITETTGGTVGPSEIIIPPEITILEPDGEDDETDLAFTITWTASDANDNASISLYYDTDHIGYDGLEIITGLTEDSDTGYLWDVSGIDEGEYYIYAVISDGRDTASVYSPGQITVRHPAGLEFETYSYPNPFYLPDSKVITPDKTITDNMIIKYVLPEDVTEVRIRIYTIHGDLVREFVSTGLSKGSHYVEWDGKNEHGNIVTSGVYLYYLEAGSNKAVHKMAVIR